MAGLPPGPIGNPGKDALLAALNPEAGPWLYFVRIDKAGNSAFTDNYASTTQYPAGKAERCLET